MHQSAIWLSEQDVASLVSLNDIIDELEVGMRSLGEGKGFNIPKALGTIDAASSMHSLGSALTEAHVCGYKNWINTPRGAKAMFVLFDSHEGRLLAFMEANVLGQLRTSAMTGLGTRWMAPEGVDEMAMVGSGRQALAQVAAVNLVRPLKRLRIWSPTADKRRAFCEQVRQQFSMEVIEEPTLEQALRDAPLVTTVTRATTPFLHADMLARGAHLNAVGAILPANAEFHQDVFNRANMIAVDDVANTRKASREFIDQFGDGDWGRVRPLGELIAKGERRPGDADITLFKSMGMGISDLSVAALAYRRAREAGIGQEIPLTTGARLRWSSAQTAQAT
ncbi:ornithine cyclodeaminase [Bordetella genomosp. 7]|uniref:ornithine cyclodeaminase family protein n=1 Tax=Bordetella genomosp. 7 TaxID=1416805 RepID=UPI000B9E6E49|nr:ornithine cyclodeaminase family protein [Bordetella genomosp. 7]OZI16977.1 ornithine cyclodeaminase [Bordetella genomosp. 7]